jgi:hypothetical protein
VVRSAGGAFSLFWLLAAAVRPQLTACPMGHGAGHAHAADATSGAVTTEGAHARHHGTDARNSAPDAPAMDAPAPDAPPSHTPASDDGARCECLSMCCGTAVAVVWPQVGVRYVASVRIVDDPHIAQQTRPLATRTPYLLPWSEPPPTA